MASLLSRAVLLAVLLVPFTAPLAGCESKDAKDVRAADARHNAAQLAHDGKNAAACMTKGSFERFDRIAELARTAGSAQLRALKMMDQIDVLVARTYFDTKQLKDMDGKALYIAEVNAVGAKPEEFDYKITKVTIVKDWAKVQFRYRGDDELLTMDFAREDGEWKYDWEGSAEREERRLKRTARDEGLAPDELVQFFVELETERDMIPEIWNGPR